MNIAIIYEHTDPNVWCTPLSLANGFRAAGHYVSQQRLFQGDRYVSLGDDIQYDMAIVMDWRGLSPEIKVNYPILRIKELGDCPQNIQQHIQGGLSWYDLLLCPDYMTTLSVKDMGHHTIWMPHWADSSLEVTTPIVCNHPPVRSTRGPGSSYILDSLSSIMPDKFLNKNGLSGQDHSEFLTRGLITVQHSRHKEYTRRIPEAMLAGSMVITDRLPSGTSIDSLFEENKQIVYYDSLPELISKINYYLSDEGLMDRMSISIGGQSVVRHHHTEKQRVETIINEYNKWSNESKH